MGNNYYIQVSFLLLTLIIVARTISNKQRQNQFNQIFAEESNKEDHFMREQNKDLKILLNFPNFNSNVMGEFAEENLNFEKNPFSTITTKLVSGSILTASSDGSTSIELTNGIVINQSPGSSIIVNDDESSYTTLDDGTLIEMESSGDIMITTKSGELITIGNEGTSISENGIDISNQSIYIVETLITTLGNGTSIVMNDETLTVVYADGSATIFLSDDTVVNVYSDGTQAILYPDGTLTTSFTDGSVSVENTDGTIIFEEIDGSVSVLYENGVVLITDVDNKMSIKLPNSSGFFATIDPTGDVHFQSSYETEIVDNSDVTNSEPDSPNEPDQPDSPDEPDRPDSPNVTHNEPDQPDSPDVTHNEPDQPDSPDVTHSEPDSPNKSEELVYSDLSYFYSDTTRIITDSFTIYYFSSTDIIQCFSEVLSRPSTLFSTYDIKKMCLEVIDGYVTLTILLEGEKNYFSSFSIYSEDYDCSAEYDEINEAFIFSKSSQSETTSANEFVADEILVYQASFVYSMIDEHIKGTSPIAVNTIWITDHLSYVTAVIKVNKKNDNTACIDAVEGVLDGNEICVFFSDTTAEIYVNDQIASLPIEVNGNAFTLMYAGRDDITRLYDGNNDEIDIYTASELINIYLEECDNKALYHKEFFTTNYLSSITIPANSIGYVWSCINMRLESFTDTNYLWYSEGEILCAVCKDEWNGCNLYFLSETYGQTTIMSGISYPTSTDLYIEYDTDNEQLTFSYGDFCFTKFPDEFFVMNILGLTYPPMVGNLGVENVECVLEYLGYASISSCKIKEEYISIYFNDDGSSIFFFYGEKSYYSSENEMMVYEDAQNVAKIYVYEYGEFVCISFYTSNNEYINECNDDETWEMLIDLGIH